MKIVKKILLGLAILIGVLLIAGLFISKEYNVEKEVTINKPRAEVFDYIKHIKNQDQYSKWAMMDPGMKKSYTGTDGTVGFISAWESEEVGTGAMEIKKITENERLDLDLRFKKPFKSNATGYMTTEDAGAGTKVKWGFNGEMTYPMNVLKPLMKSALGDDLQTGLDRLKANLEK